MASAIEEIGQAFVKHYYTTFDNNREALIGLYTDQSKLSFEGTDFQGAQAICEKLKSLPFATVVHIITTVDCQPTVDQRITIAVLGQLKTDNDPPHSFFQTFLLAQANNSWVVLNDIFRLVIHNG